jgi:hypothetical protein
VKGFDQVNLAEDGAAIHVGGEVHHVGQGYLSGTVMVLRWR